MIPVREVKGPELITRKLKIGILDFLKHCIRMKGYPPTAAELAHWYGQNATIVLKTLQELRRDGLVVGATARRCSVHGGHFITWKLCDRRQQDLF